MEPGATRKAIIRYGLLFLISVLLVAGFWFHGSFYAIGLYPLLLLGGFVTFLVILAVRAVVTGALRRVRPRGTIAFSREEGERVLAGTKTLAILPLGVETPPAGVFANASLEDNGQLLARIKVRDIRRRLAGDLSKEEAAAAGFGGLKEFQRAWAQTRQWNPREIVVLVEFSREPRP